MKKLFSPWWLLVIAALGTAGLACVYWGSWSIHPNVKATELGQLGDFFGGLLNPLVSALTLFVAISVWRLQKDELELTRNEMAQTKLAMEDQAKTSEQQRQEQRFFDLLNVYQRTVESISMTRTQSSGRDTSELLTSNGKQAISVWLRATSLDKTALNPFNSILVKSKVASHWQIRDAPGMFDHYFRVVFRLLFEAEKLLGDQHHRYVELFQAQLSRAELIILGYSLWLNDEDQNMTSLADKYHLLEHLPTGHLRTEMETLHPNMFRTKQALSDQPLHPSESESQPC